MADSDAIRRIMKKEGVGRRHALSLAISRGQIKKKRLRKMAKEMNWNLKRLPGEK